MPPVDTAQFPVVIVVLDASVEGPISLAGVVRDLDAVLERREPMGFVFDYRTAPPDTQQRISQWLAERVDFLRAFVVGAVTVVDEHRLEHVQSLIAGGMFPMPFDAWATATVDDGVRWVQDRFAAATAAGPDAPG